jgi:uncharacterized phage protein (TIGR02218 family)
MTDAYVSEAFVSAVCLINSPPRVSEAYVSAVVHVKSPPRVSEAFMSAVVKVQAGALVTEAFLQALVYRAPCASNRADFWKITRTDGQVFAFTSHDEDVTWGNVTYRHCGSLQDSAAESDSDIASVGSVSLMGLITDDAITEDDLYAGRFDDAYVESWQAPWGDQADSAAPFMVASGWTGKVSRRINSWSAEVLGASAKLGQTALVDFFQPGCRWVFGSPSTAEQPGCGIDAQAFRQFGIAVEAIVGRGIINFAPEAIPSMDALWNNGTLIWTYGRNTGIQLQIETMDWASGVLSLWDLMPFPAQPGDTFDIIPGCSYDRPGCKVYNNYDNYGGYPDVPGPDALQQNADALFSANGGS